MGWKGEAERDSTRRLRRKRKLPLPRRVIKPIPGLLLVGVDVEEPDYAAICGFEVGAFGVEEGVVSLSALGVCVSLAE